MWFHIILSILATSGMYFYLQRKTKINRKLAIVDGIIVITTSVAVVALVNYFTRFSTVIDSIILLSLIPSTGFILTMIRFWRVPQRRVSAVENDIISPADGNIIYIKEIPTGEVPVSIKKGVTVQLKELVKTEILATPCWLIGINMTPYDLHKNCAPISGKIILNNHFNGEFLSLKSPEASTLNERNTLVIENDQTRIGIVQTASRLVRRIDSYVLEGDYIEKGKWFGMIRFGSQVDVIIPKDFQVKVQLGQQVYAVKTIIARK